MNAQFIVACDPDENNLVDFLRLIKKYRPKFIVSMTSAVNALATYFWFTYNQKFKYILGNVFSTKTVNKNW